MSLTNVDIQLLAGLNINSSEAEILKAIKIIQRNLYSNQQAEIKLNTNIDVNALQTAVAKLQELFKRVDLSLNTKDSINGIQKEATAMMDVVQSANKASHKKQEFAKANKQVEQSAKDTADAITKEHQAMEKLDDLNYILKNVNASGNAGNSVFQTFGHTLNQAFQTYTTANLLTDAIRKTVDAGKEAVETVKELNDEATSLRMATGGESSYVDGLMDSYNELGQELGAITSSVSQSADEWLRQGHSIEDTNELIRDSMILSKVSNLDSAEATKYLTSAYQGYKVAVKDVIGIVDKLSGVDLVSATDAGGLAEAMSRTAQGAEIAGISMDRLLGMIATTGEVTQKSMSSIGETFKTLFSRMRNIKDGNLSLIGENGEIEDLSNVEIVLEGVGIKLRESNMEFRNFQDVLDDVARSWNNYSSVQQAAIAKSFSGVRNQENFLVLMENWDKVVEYTNVSANSAGTSTEKFGYYLESLEAKTNSLKASLEAMATATISDELYASVLDTSKEIVDLTTETGILKGLLAGLGTSGSIYAFQQLTHYLHDAAQGFASLNEAMAVTRSGAVGINDMQKLIDLTGGLSKSQTKLLLSTNNLTDAQKIAILMNQGMSKAQAQAFITTYNLSTAQQGATTATITLTGAIKGLWTTLLANPLVLVTMAVTAGVTAFTSYKNKMEEVRQITVDASSTFKQATISVGEYISKYEELQKSLTEACGNEEQVAGIKQQLIDLQAELNSKYGEEASTINLVTGEYKKQIEAIRALNKEEAHKFLNENREGISTATKKMEQEKDYILTFGTVTGYSSKGKALQEVANKYADKGLTVEKNSITSTMELQITANPQTAYDVINDFESDLRAKAIELGDEHLFDDVFETSSKALNKAKKTVDKYGDIYDQALMAQLVTNEPMSEVYNEALTAVEEYNNAISTGEGIAEAKQNLESVKSQIEENADVWGRYKSITEDLFAQAGTSVEEYGQDVSEVMDNVSESTESTKSQMIDAINSMSNGFDILDYIYADIVDKGTFDFTNLDSSKFKDAFSEITPEYEKFIETISASPDDINTCQQAFNELVDAYINSKGILENLIEENAELTASMLKNMGIANAEEIVMAYLSGEVEELALYKQFAAEKGYELANATYAEASEFITEAEASAVAKQELAQLALEKINVNENQISTASDIDNIITLAEAARAGTAELAQLAKAKSVLSAVESAGSRERAGISEKAYQEALKTVEQINNGTFDYNYAKIDRSQFKLSDYGVTPNYSGGESTASALEKSAKEASEKAKDSYNDFYDFMERRTEVLNDSFEQLEKGMENVVGAFAKNKLIDGQLGVVDEQINNYTDALAMYKEQANNVLSTIDNEELRNKIINGAVELTDIQGENEEQVKAALDAYSRWSGKVAETTQKLEELRTQIRQLELQKFENIVEDYTNQFGMYGDSIDLIKGQIGLLEEAGELVGKSFYTAQIEQSEKQLTTLEKQKADMVKQMTDAINSGRIQKGTEEWVEMQAALTEVESEIINVRTNIEELNNELLELNWQIFDRIQNEIVNITDEIGNLANLFDDFNDIRVSDGAGKWTDEAIATLGLYAQQLEANKYQIQQYSDAINQLESEYNAGNLSATEYMDKLAELKQEQWNCVESVEAMEDAIVSLNQQRVEEEIESIEKAIDKYEEYTDAAVDALNAQKDLHDYKKSISDKTNEIEKLEREIVSMKNDTSAATTALRLQKEAELSELKDELSEMEYEHSIESQKSALEKQLQEYTDARNAETEELQASLENRELLISQSFETVKQNADIVGQEIAMIVKEHGITVSDAIITSWANGETAIASYGAVLSAQSSAFIGNVMGVEAQVYSLQAQADNSALALSNMFATRADNLVSELQSSYYAEDNLNYATGVLQNSLINTLERGYDISGISSAISGIISGLSSVENQASRTAQAIREALGAQEEAKTYYHMGVSTSGGKSKYYVSDLYGNDTKWYNSYEEASKALDKLKTQNYNYKAYAKGSKFISKDQLGWTQDKGGEMIFRRSDGAILTPLKRGDAIANAALTENLFEWGKINPNQFMPEVGKASNYKIDVPVKTVERDVIVNYQNIFNGDFNSTDQLIDKMNEVAKSTTTKILNDINRDFRIRSR